MSTHLFCASGDSFSQQMYIFICISSWVAVSARKNYAQYTLSTKRQLLLEPRNDSSVNKRNTVDVFRYVFVHIYLVRVISTHSIGIKPYTTSLSRVVKWEISFTFMSTFVKLSCEYNWSFAGGSLGIWPTHYCQISKTSFSGHFTTPLLKNYTTFREVENILPLSSAETNLFLLSSFL